MPDGRTHPDEYVRDLAEPLRRMATFEEMGNSDDAVRNGIDSRRQEMNAANWTLASEDKTPRGQEILEFVEDNLYPHLDDLIRWLAGGALQYGVGCVEPVFTWSDSPPVASIARGKLTRATKAGARRIWLAKLAHLRQRSIETFQIAPTGDLEQVWQYVYNGVQFARVKVPAEKLLVWTYNRQGDDYWGMPPARHCYKAWTFKVQIERLNILSFDRFGVGTPVAEAGEGWTATEYAVLEKFLKNFRAGDSSYLVHPNGGAISIVSGDGKMTASGLAWVQAYNLWIAKTYLTHQSEMIGQSQGSRAMVETFYEQMEGIVQADCEDLANLINNQLIVPLVNWNYGPQDTYPAFAPSQRVRAGAGIGTIVQTLISSGAIHVRPEDEAFFRDVLGLPAVAIETLQAEQTARDAKAAAIAGARPDPNADPNAAPGATAADPAKGPAAAAPAAPARVAASRALTLVPMSPGAPDPAAPGATTYRSAEYSAWEYGVLRPDVLTRDLDLQTARGASEAQDVLNQIDAELARQVAALAAQGVAALTAGVRTIAVPAALRAKLRAVLLAAALRAKAYGATAVRNEVERQLGPSAVGPARAPGFYAQQPTAGATTDDLRLQAEVDGAVETEIDRREQSARSGALTAIAQAATATASVLASVAAVAVKAGLIGLSLGRTRDNLEGVVNVGFGVGRSTEADAIHEAATSGSGGGAGAGSGLRDAQGQPIDLVAKVYSAVMDDGTCPECAKWDGAEFPIDYPEDVTGVQAPNPRCDGGYARCRCVWIYITNLEQVPLVPAAKGPLPIRGAA